MSELTKYIEEHLVAGCYGEYDGIIEPTLVGLYALRGLVESEIRRKEKQNENS